MQSTNRALAARCKRIRFSTSVRIVEVGPRDGLQNEPLPAVSMETKVELVQKLLKSGIQSIEVGAFVSPKWVPQMANSSDVFAQLRELVAPEDYANFSALTPNMKGLESAIALGVHEVAIFGAASESFSKRNINCSIQESLDRFEEVARVALETKLPNGETRRVRGYISCVLGCPYEGYVQPERVSYVAQRMLDMGCYEVSVGDTIGTGNAGTTAQLLTHLLQKKEDGGSIGFPVNQLAVHFHNTYGQALANIHTALQAGVRVIDSSVSGLGGCPYAKGASGNVATEEVLYMLQGLGISTAGLGGCSGVRRKEVDMDLLLDAADFIDKRLGGRVTQSKVAAALLSKRQ